MALKAGFKHIAPLVLPLYAIAVAAACQPVIFDLLSFFERTNDPLEILAGRSASQFPEITMALAMVLPAMTALMAMSGLRGWWYLVRHDDRPDASKPTRSGR